MNIPPHSCKLISLSDTGSTDSVPELHHRSPQTGQPSSFLNPPSICQGDAQPKCSKCLSNHTKCSPFWVDTDKVPHTCNKLNIHMSSNVKACPYKKHTKLPCPCDGLHSRASIKVHKSCFFIVDMPIHNQ